MIKKDDKGNIEITRGDYLPITLKTRDRFGNPYTFQVGDIVRISITKKSDCDEVMLRKDFEVTEPSEEFSIELLSEETRIGEVISKPAIYWYDVELNPDSPEAQTIIGYTVEGGPKTITLTPESGKGGVINA